MTSHWTNPRRKDRRGTALVLFAICMIPLIASVALAVDLGLLVLAQTQVSDAADAAALAGARVLNGNTATATTIITRRFFPRRSRRLSPTACSARPCRTRNSA